jgi:hypothetical protein
MKKPSYAFFTFNIFLASCLSLYSQTTDQLSRIKVYCDSLDNIEIRQTILRTGEAISLEYIISKGEVVMIIEQPLGYKFIFATVTYYIQNNSLVHINADIERSNDEGSKLTIELHKIYFNNQQLIEHLSAEQTFDSDTIYNNHSDPIKAAAAIRENARFQRISIDQEFEKKLLKTLDNYLKARTREVGDPAYDNLYSPFL